MSHEPVRGAESERRLELERKTHNDEESFSLGWFSETLRPWQEDALAAAVAALGTAIRCERFSTVSWADSSATTARDGKWEHKIRTGPFGSRPAWLYTFPARGIHDLVRLAWRFDRPIIFSPVERQRLTRNDVDALLESPVARAPLTGLPLLVHGADEHLWVDVHSAAAERDVLVRRVEATLVGAGIEVQHVIDQM